MLALIGFATLLLSQEPPRFVGAGVPDTPPIHDLAGNWIAEVRDFPERGKVERRPLVITDPRIDYCLNAPGGGCLFRRIPAGKNYLEITDLSTGDSAPIDKRSRPLRLDHPSFLKVTFPAAISDAMTADWVHPSFNNGEPSVARLHRAEPEVTQVRFLSAVRSEARPGGEIPRVVTRWDSSWSSAGNQMRSAPNFTIEIYGNNFWGYHDVYFADAVDLYPAPAAPIANPQSTGDPEKQVIGLRVPVFVVGNFLESASTNRAAASRGVLASPGRKTLVVDKVAIPFELVIQDFPGKAGAVKELRYVELKNGRYIPLVGALNHGATFFVEVEFDSRPTEPEHVVNLSWGEGTEVGVKVRPTADPTIFRSEAIRLEPPMANER